MDDLNKDNKWAKFLENEEKPEPEIKPRQVLRSVQQSTKQQKAILNGN